MKSHCLTVPLLGCFAALVSMAHAQVPQAIEQTESLKRRSQSQEMLDKYQQMEAAPELFKGELTDVGPQSILKLKQRKTYFEAVLDSQFFFTSNMLLQEDGPGVNLTDTTVFVNTAQVALAPRPYQVGKGLLAPRLGFRHQWFNYGLGDVPRVNAFDFDVQTVFTDLRYRFAGNWVAEVGFDALRLLNHTPAYSTYDEFYRELVTRWGLQWQHAFTETRVFAAGYEGAWHFSNTPGNPQRNLNDRGDHSLLLAYTHALTPQFVLQPYYRFQYTMYSAVPSRNDFLHTTGISLNYYFNRWLAARVFYAYDHKDSDDPLVADYRKHDGGLGVNVTFRF